MMGRLKTMDVLVNGESVKGVLDKERVMDELRNVPYEAGNSIKYGFKLTCIC